MINRQHISLDGMRSEAFYSDCERYRYALGRIWDPGRPSWLFIGCNPSTATEVQNDPTIERMQRRARNAGAGSLAVVNCYAWRSTDPDDLMKVADPSGPQNDHVIVANAIHSEVIVCGWGNHRAIRDRSQKVLEILRDLGLAPMALKLNKDGSPAHPLYLPYSAQPFPMVAA